MPPNVLPPYHLDTNVFVHAVRDDATWTRIKLACDPLLTERRPCFTYISHAEILPLAAQWNWGPDKLDRLSCFLGYFERLDTISDKLLRAYGEIDVFSLNRPSPIKMGKNDLWIAATVYVTNAILVTTDKDFDHLHSVFFDRILIPY